MTGYLSTCNLRQFRPQEHARQATGAAARLAVVLTFCFPAAAGSASYEIRLTCPTTVQLGRLQFGLVLPDEAMASTADFGGIDPSSSCEAPPPDGAGCTNATLIGPTVDKPNSFMVRGSDIANSQADPPPPEDPIYDTLFFSLLGTDPGGDPNLCDVNPVETLAVVQVVSVSTTEPATLSQNDSNAASGATLGAYADPPEPVLDPSGAPVAGTSWAYVTGDGLADVQVLVSPAIDPNGGRDWVVKLDSVAELRRAKLGFQTPASETFEFVGCDATDCTLAGGLLGPTVDPSLSRSEHNALLRVLYVVLEGNLDAESVFGEGGPGDNTLLNVPNYPSPSRVTLGVLRVPASVAGITPAFSLEQVDLVAPTGPPFVIPGPDADPYPSPVDLTGTGEITGDVDADFISNDCDNCPVYPNVFQTDVGGLEVSGQPPPRFDGVGDACQCGDIGGDGSITPPGSPNPWDPGDVRQLQDVLAGVPLDPDPQLAAALAQAALERCSVSGETTPGGSPSGCDIKDLLTLALAIDGQVPGLSGVCARNMPGQALDQ